MARYDIETLITDISTIMTDNLAAKIAAINSEKNDGITLKDVPSGGVILQSMDGKIANYNPFLYIGVVDLQGEDQPHQSRSLQRADVAVLMVLADEAQDSQIWKKLFRYQRVIREIFEEKFDSISGQLNLKVKSQVPIELALVNNSYSHKAIGVTVSADIS